MKYIPIDYECLDGGFDILTSYDTIMKSWWSWEGPEQGPKQNTPSPPMEWDIRQPVTICYKFWNQLKITDNKP